MWSIHLFLQWVFRLWCTVQYALLTRFVVPMICQNKEKSEATVVIKFYYRGNAYRSTLRDGTNVSLILLLKTDVELYMWPLKCCWSPKTWKTVHKCSKREENHWPRFLKIKITIVEVAISVNMSERTVRRILYNRLNMIKVVCLLGSVSDDMWAEANEGKYPSDLVKKVSKKHFDDHSNIRWSLWLYTKNFQHAIKMPAS